MRTRTVLAAIALGAGAAVTTAAHSVDSEPAPTGGIQLVVAPSD